VAAVDDPGLSALGLVSNLQFFTPSAQTKNEVMRTETAALMSAGAKGRAVLHDIDVYLQGINAYIRAHGDVLGIFHNVVPFTRLDIYGFNALKDQTERHPGANRLGDERGSHPGRSRDDLRAGALETPARRQGAERSRR
jgi:hypothetical protein